MRGGLTGHGVSGPLPAAVTLAACLGMASCGPASSPAEREIFGLVEEALRAVKAGDPLRLQELYLVDPRYSGPSGRSAGGEEVVGARLQDFCTTPGFDYDPPAPQVAVLRNRAVVTFDLDYRFRRDAEVIQRKARVTLFVERRPQGWRILRDSLVFPSETQPEPSG